MDHTEKPEFARLCRELRVNHQPYLKQRQVAEAIGVAVSTYGNIESSPYMVVGEPGARRIARFYDLDRDQTDRLLAAWRALPLSKHGEKRRKAFAVRNTQRSKAKHHDRLMVSLCEVLGLLLPKIPEAEVCGCDMSQTCEVCTALEVLGLDPFSTTSAVVDQLAELGDRLERAAQKVEAP